MPDSAACVGAQVSVPWSGPQGRGCGDPGSGRAGPAPGCALCPVNSQWLRAKACMFPHVGVPVCPCVWVCAAVFFFTGFDGEDEISFLDRAGLSFLPLPWPEAPRAWNR